MIRVTDVCLFMCLYMCTDIYIYIHMTTWQCPHFVTSLHLCMYVYTYMCVSMCISMCLYMCMSVHVCARDTRLKVRERVPENAHPCIHARAHTHRDPGADGTDIRCAGTKISMRKS